MSLLYWLPLTNDIKNQGVGVLGSPTFNTLTQMGGGKIGKCYKNRCVFPINDEFDNKWTIACWFKQIQAIGTSSTMLITQTTSNAGDGAFYFTLYLDSSTNKINTRLGVNEYSTTTCELPENPEVDKWFHMAATYDGTTYKIYYNGSLLKQGTKTSTKQSGANICLGCRRSDTGWDNYYCFNDVRIYNHVLSEREIRLLSQGLLVHYPLSVGGMPNLLKNVSGMARKYSNTCTATTQENISVPEWGTDKATRVYGKQTNLSIGFYLFGGSSAYLDCNSISVDGQKYTQSVYIKNNHSTNSIRVRTNLPRDPIITVAPNESKKVVTAGTGNGVNLVQIHLMTTGEDFDLTWYHPKIEYGEVCTPWMPATSDTEYHTMGFDSNIEYDVSGLKHNMTMNNIEIVSDTPRYNTAYKFDSSYGVSDEILPSGQIFNEFTMSFWMKLDQSAPNMYVLYYGIVTLSKNESYSSLMITATVSNQDGTSTTEYSWVDNNTFSDLYDYQWHHVCYTFKDGIFKVYVDGTYKAYSDRTQYGTYIKAKGNKVLGANNVYGNPYKGCLSDFRIYATELSAEDVQRLYSSPISISNNGTLLTNSIDEN